MITFVNCFKSAAQQCQVAERLIVVTEIIAVWPDYYPIAIMVFPHPWQSSIFIRFPRMKLVHLVLAFADFAQIFDVIVKPIAVDVVNLHRRKPPVVPSPDYDVHLEFTMSATDIKIHKQISVFTISLTVRPTFNHPARLLVHKLSALGVVVVVPLDASHQCGQLAICQINSIHNFFKIIQHLTLFLPNFRSRGASPPGPPSHTFAAPRSTAACRSARNTG